MGDVDIKNLLKDARDCVKHKKFNEAIEKCKVVLDEDPKNYMALVLMGAAYQDINKSEAAKHLKCALTYAKDPTVPLQGLLNCSDVEELPSICDKLLTLTPQKYSELHKKLEITTITISNITPVIEVLKKELDCGETERRDSARKCLVQIFFKTYRIDSKLNEIFLDVLDKELVTMSFDEKLKNEKKLLSFFYNLKRYDLVIVLAKEILALDKTVSESWLYIARVYIKYIEQEEISKCDSLNELAIETASVLLQRNYDEYSVYLLNAILLHDQNSLIEAREYCVKAYDKNNTNGLILTLLGKIFSEFNAFMLAEYFYRKVNVKSIEFIRSLVEQKSIPKSEEAIILCKELIPKANKEEQIALIELLTKSLITMNSMDAANKAIEKLQLMNAENEVNKLLALKSIKDMDSNENILSLLNKITIENAEILIEKAKIEENLKNFNNALNHYIKAIKLEPVNSNAFYSLGQFYYNINDESRAIKCLEKCVYLNPQHKMGTTLYSYCLRLKKDWDTNINLIDAAIKSSPSHECDWAYSLKAFHFMALGSYDKAINSFRTALHGNVCDPVIWEGLADAYYQRGSYHSAQKVYQKIFKDTENIYAKVREGEIHVHLQNYSDAIDTLKEALQLNPEYFPALKAISEAFIGLSRHYKNQCLLKRSRFNIEESIVYLAKAACLKPNYACIWHMLGQVIRMIGCFPKSLAYLQIPRELNKGGTGGIVKEKDLLLLSRRCLFNCLKLRPNDGFVWHDLALNYYYISKKYGDGLTAEKQINVAYNCAYKAVQLNPDRINNWNLLGVICTNPEILDFKMAQHCFIKGLKIDKKSSICWINLGLVYLMHSDIKLANKCFNNSQQIDAERLEAWIGQALIAETIDDKEEAMDLFRHCTQLGFHFESAHGYADWVCQALTDGTKFNKRVYDYAIKKMHAISVATDAINWFCTAEDYSETISALTHYGYLAYHEGLYKTTIDVYEKALVIAKDGERDLILLNLGFAYLKANEPVHAIKTFSIVGEKSLRSILGLAYAYLKAGDYEKSCIFYENALNVAGTTIREKAESALVLAGITYAFSGDEAAKEHIYYSLQLMEDYKPNPRPIIDDLYSACSLGILHDDRILAELALKEMNSLISKMGFNHHIAFLNSQYIQRYDSKQKAYLYLMKQIHLYPDNAELRRVAVQYMLTTRSIKSNQYKSVTRLAESILRLQLQVDKRITSLEAAKILTIASQIASYGDQRREKILAQKALFLNPTCNEARRLIYSQ